MVIFRNIKGMESAAKGLVKAVIEKGTLMEHAIPVYYLLRGFGNESLENPDYETWRDNSMETLSNINKMSEDSK